MPAVKPRILIVTPEITYLPEGMGNMAQRMSAKAGGLADVSASLVAALFDLGADVHVALPNYRQMFNTDVYEIFSRELQTMRERLPDERIHLAEDRIFYYRDSVYSSYGGENPRIALAFQREVLNHIVPRVQPDLIHCNDWMTGLVPAAARRYRIPTLFTVHNIHTEKLTVAQIEDCGIDAAQFWQDLYYATPPGSYEHARYAAPVDQLASGIFAAHYINTVSPSFLEEVAEGRHSFVPPAVQREIRNKRDAGCAIGILNAPDVSYNPLSDISVPVKYNAENFPDGKSAAKAEFQERTGLMVNPDAPVFFWPSRLDPVQKGPQLLTAILYKIVSENWHDSLQVAVVANGEYQRFFRDIVRQHNFQGRVAVCDFNEGLSRLGYAASDFCFMPSSFEPCGLPQMVAPIYGSLTIAHNTGGLKDTVSHLGSDGATGNGFVFEHFNPDALHWAVNQAMSFYRRPAEEKEKIIGRIMRESSARFNHATCAQAYFHIYETMLERPLILPKDPVPAKSEARKAAQPKTGVPKRKKKTPDGTQEPEYEAAEKGVPVMSPGAAQFGVSP